MGIVVAGFGALLIWRTRKEIAPQVLAQDANSKSPAPLTEPLWDE